MFVATAWITNRPETATGEGETPQEAKRAALARFRELHGERPNTYEIVEA